MGMSNQTEEKELFHAVSLSGGKDSTAMLLLMIERGLPIDAVLTADTGMEFPEMYEHLQKLDDYLFAERGLHLTWLRHPKGFEWLMFEEKKQRPASIENRQRLGVSLWTSGRWHSSAPARWGNSRRIGVWNGWNSDLRQKRSSFLFHPRRRSVNDDVSRTE